MSIDWVFGEYKILKKIAVGGMAEVFLAKRVGVKGFEKLLAIKRILPQFSENEEFISMFIDEAKLAAQLNHSNIVQIYDFGSHQDSHYIAMEYIFGKDLRSILKKSKERQERLPETQCAYVATEAAKALEYAHTLKDHFGRPLQIIHRDISPQNILISYEGEMMLADFGIAKAASKSTETRAGVLKGKILYMSPEQAWGKSIDKRSDLYSLGVILYEMVSDRKIFDADSEFSMLEKVRNAQVEFPPEIFEKVPKRLFYIIKKALEKRPGDRYQSAHEMRVDLEDYLLAAQETLSEKMLSNYLKRLFRNEMEEERKIFAESQERQIEKPIPVEPVPKTELQEPDQIPQFERGQKEVEEVWARRLFITLRDAFQKINLRMRVGALVVFFILGGLILTYLFTEKPSTTVPQTDVPLAPSLTTSSSPSTTSPKIKIDLPKEKSKVPDEEKRQVPPAERPGLVPKKEKEARISETEQKRSTSLTDLLNHGPQLLQENKHIELLEQINQLSHQERQNTHIKILESFAHLKKWVLQKDRNSKVLWNQLYNGLEHSGDPSATPLLLNIARDPEEWTRLYAVALLGNIGDRRALEYLNQIAATDSNWRIRKNASKAISLIQNRG
jgi:serine/threonine protein kinase